MKTRHYAALSTFIIAVVSLAVVSYLRNDPKPKVIGEFEFEGTRTQVIQAGDCQVFITKWKSSDNPSFFFSCDNNK